MKNIQYLGEEMSSPMDGVGCENQERVQINLRKQLALAVRSIRWSYAIFWSISSKNPGVLEWFDGYYNRDIKTRKTVQAGEVNNDEQGLQRSEQLRELYESLLAGESDPQSKRPSAALSPEDLTDAEWYYLVCMSFTFNIGQGDSLPGRTLKKNQTIWISNAHQADNKAFSRSLLAKASKSSLTVVCFPHVGGIVEVGITEQVAEDPNLVQLMKTSVSEISIPFKVMDKSSSHVSENAGNDKDISSSKFDNDTLESHINPPAEVKIKSAVSPDNGSNGYETLKLPEEYYIEGINRVASQVQGDSLMEEDIASHFHNSVNSSDSISQNNGSEERICISNGKNTKSCLHEVQECKQKDMDCLDSQRENIHYHSILSNLLKSSHQLIHGAYFRNHNRDSSFTSWKKNKSICIQKPQTDTPQKLLKKVLLEVAKMHEGTFIRSMKDEKIESVGQQEAIKNEENLGLPEQKHREKMNDRFSILHSLVPTNGKMDKVSVLDGTIEYLMELKRRINELESHKEVNSKTRRKRSDSSERTSDNYGTVKESERRGHTRKTNVCEIDDVKHPSKRSLLGESSSYNISVNMIDKEILIDLKFPSRDGVFLEIMEVLSNFHLGCNAIQSTNNEGVLTVTLQSKPKGLTFPLTAKIKEALQRVLHN
ncbi:DNA-binding transcription factor [Lithospermum erythrorhizon]|uniref:DNA-binding transcription factor n=1 Tax=Lithospermum erythrorhizon TaxID=34254 RepID=A0AAV3PPW6_LITER